MEDAEQVSQPKRVPLFSHQERKVVLAGLVILWVGYFTVSIVISFTLKAQSSLTFAFSLYLVL